MNIRRYIRQLVDDYKGHASAVGRLRGPHIFIGIHQLIDEYIGLPVRSVPPSIFVDDVSPTNVIGYIHRFYVTGEYIVTFISTNE
jgi:hypothetical protein